MSERAFIKALAKGQDSWGRYGSSTEHDRYFEAAPNRRRKCACGCEGRLTHVGMANGVALMGGCEFKVRRWVRVGFDG